MPTYQYACTACDERLEVVQKFSDEPLTVCPACEGKLRKVFSPVGVVFKGSGFYRTDSRSEGRKDGAAAKTDSKAESKSETSSTAGKDGGSSSGDAKPAAKSDSSAAKKSSDSATKVA